MEEQLDQIITSIKESKKLADIKSEYPSLSKFSPIEMGVISFLDKNMKASAKEITEALNISKSSLNSLIKRFEKDELLEKIDNPKDKRSYLLTLTNKGQSIARENSNFKIETYAILLDALSAKERRKFFIALNKMANNFLDKE